jgi:hypothetical protein
MVYALRVRTLAAPTALPALIAHLRTLRALSDLGERRLGFHEGFHGGGGGQSIDRRTIRVACTA